MYCIRLEIGIQCRYRRPGAMCTLPIMMTKVLLDFEASLWSQHVQQFSGSLFARH